MADSLDTQASNGASADIDAGETSEWLEAVDAVLTHEPGATRLGARLRELLLDPNANIDPRAEALLLAADRAQHVAEVIGPALASGNFRL